MKEIDIFFLTQKGIDAYRAVEKAGEGEKGINKRIVRRIYRDSVVSEDPLVVRVKIKIQRLAIVTELDKQIIKGLEDKGAKNGKDFKLEVKWK
jgi:hypothetical protein